MHVFRPVALASFSIAPRPGLLFAATCNPGDVISFRETCSDPTVLSNTYAYCYHYYYDFDFDCDYYYYYQLLT